MLDRVREWRVECAPGGLNGSLSVQDVGKGWRGSQMAFPKVEEEKGSGPYQKPSLLQFGPRVVGIEISRTEELISRCYTVDQHYLSAAR